MKKLKMVVGIIGICTFWGLNTVTNAQNDMYPSKPIKIIVPFPPGGPTDIVARAVANEISKQFKQPMIVENKAGANGTIGTAYVAKAKPDGYTILYNTSSLAISPALYNNLGFNPTEDFTAVSSTTNIPLVILVHPKVGISSFDDFLKKLKDKNNQLTYGSAGLGNITHLGAELFISQIKGGAMHVPYKGSSPAMVDLVGGQFDFMMNTLNDSLPFIYDKKVEVLGITSKKPNEDVIPGIKTISQQLGVDFSVGAWQGIVVPKDTPKEVVNKLNQAVNAAIETEEFKALAKKQGFEVLGGSSETYQKFIAKEVKLWDDIAKKINLQKN